MRHGCDRSGGFRGPPHCCAQLRGYWTKEQNGETCLFSRHLVSDILLSLERGRTGVRQPIFPKLFADCALQVVQSSGGAGPFLLPSPRWGEGPGGRGSETPRKRALIPS